MRGRSIRLPFVLIVLLGSFAWLDAVPFVPITSDRGRSAAWSPSDLPVDVAINVNGSGVDPEQTANALRRGFAAWEAVGSFATFIEVEDPAQRARRDWDSLDSSLVLFDTNGSSGLFGGGPSQTIAVTPILIAGNGRILDADIVFNARDFQFSVDGSAQAMDIENIGTHELGHLLGLDHTGFIGATMFPFSEEGETLRRSLADDDRAGLIAAYGSPLGEPSGALSGRVVRGGGTPIRGAHVVLLDEHGVSVRSTITDRNGNYEFPRLEDGSYRLYADPLDGPVDASNLLIDPEDVQIDFSTTFLGGNANPIAIDVLNGASTNLVDLEAEPELASFDADPTSPRVLEVFPGRTGFLRVFGQDTVNAIVSDRTDALRLARSVVAPGTLRIEVEVDLDARPGLYDLFLEDPTSGRLTALTGVVDVGPGPVIEAIHPPAGSVNGGTFVEVRGRNFDSRSAVRLGGGPPLNPFFQGSTRLTFTTPPNSQGPRDLEIDDPLGGITVGRGAFTYVAGLDPTLVAVDPAVGDPAGGEVVTITGTNFQSGAIVRFGANPLSGLTGVPATDVQFVDPSTLRVTTPPNTSLGLGRQNVLVENPNGTSVFAELWSYSQLVASGTRFEGTIARPGEVDRLGMEVLAGMELKIQLRADRTASLSPVFEIEDAMGTILLSSDEGDPAFQPEFVRVRGEKVQVRKWVAPVTEALQLRIRDLGEGTGAYELRVDAKLPREARSFQIRSGEAVLSAGSPLEIPFEVLSGTELSGKVQFEKDAGLALTIELEGPGGTIALVPGQTPGVEGDERRLTFRRFQLTSFGAHRLTLTTSTGQSGPKASLKFREPKLRQTLVE